MDRVKVYYFMEADWMSHGLASKLTQLVEPQVMYIRFVDPKAKKERKPRVPKNKHLLTCPEGEYIAAVTIWYKQVDFKPLKAIWTNLDVDYHSRKAYEWLITKTDKRKTDLDAFLKNWLRNQNPELQVKPTIRSL